MIKRVVGILMVLVIALSTLNGMVIYANDVDDSVKDFAPQPIDDSISNYKNYIETADCDYAKSEFFVSAEEICHANNLSLSATSVEQGSFFDWEREISSISFEVNLESAAFYELIFNYMPLNSNGNAIELSLQLDGKSPYDKIEKIVLPRLWKNNGNNRVDSLGNETPATQVEANVWYDYTVCDSTGVITKPLLIKLPKGKHIVTIINNNKESFYLKKLTFAAPLNVPLYKDYIKKYKNSDVKKIIIEAEDAVLKTENSFVGKAERNSATVSPSSYCLDKINYIGGSNWAHPSEKIIWDLNVKKSGYYKLVFNYRQNYVLNGNSYRIFTIDGEIPFLEASELSFPYNTNWGLLEYADKDGNPYLIYLDEGRHTLALEVTLGPMAEVYDTLSNQVEILGQIYRKMVMIMGTTPDANRDYDLFEQITNLEETFIQSYKSLGEISKKICELTGNKSDSNTVIIDGMRDSIDKFLKNPYRTQKYKDDYYDNYCSLGAIISEMSTMPLDLDMIAFIPENENIKQFSVSAFKKMQFSLNRFISTFVQDYSSVSDVDKDSKEKISIWLYWGKDQVQVLNNLIKEDFTPNTGIQVDIKITSSSLIQALLCDDTPDVYLRHNGQGTMNMSMRGALYDLQNFKDFEEISKRFMPNSLIPYKFNGGCYALPDTETYNMLFYRTDIFKEYGISVPNTWNQFLDISTYFFHNNLQIGMPNTFNTFATFLYQNGGSIYNENLSEVMFDSNVFVDSFTYYTNFYKEYGFELTYDFYNRFRTGEMPMAIADYGQYNVLKVSAPEIDGKWAMAILPGVVIKDNIVSTGIATGTGSSIIKTSNKKEAAWEFLKWWTDTKAQTRFSNECESILGPSARQQTANIKALQNLSWNSKDLEALISQWGNTKTIPETPGSYYTERMYSQAFWSVVNNGSNQRNTLVKWGDMANQEIARKRAEYNLD